MRPGDSQRGFTLLEALVSITIFLAALTAVLVTYASGNELFARGERRVEIQQHARWAVGEMSRKIRMAGFFPENFASPPAFPLLADPIRIATDGGVAIYGDADDSGASNVFLYCLDGEVLRRGRGAIDNADSYDCSSGEILAENVIALRFTFYDADGNPIPSPPAAPFALDGQATGNVPDMSDTAQRAQVRRVVFSLTVRERVGLEEEQLYTLSSNVTMRNAQ